MRIVQKVLCRQLMRDMDDRSANLPFFLRQLLHSLRKHPAIGFGGARISDPVALLDRIGRLVALAQGGRRGRQNYRRPAANRNLDGPRRFSWKYSAAAG